MIEVLVLTQQSTNNFKVNGNTEGRCSQSQSRTSNYISHLSYHHIAKILQAFPPLCPSTIMSTERLIAHFIQCI